MSFAISPFGPGTTAAGNAPPSKPARRAAFLDPKTKDFGLDTEGERDRMPEVRQQFLLALTTLFESSTVAPEKGVSLPRKVTDDIQRQAHNAVELACKHITDAGRAKITRVVAEETQMGRVQVKVDYDDLTLNEEGSVVV